jgi:hypothetical protein
VSSIFTAPMVSTTNSPPLSPPSSSPIYPSSPTSSSPDFGPTLSDLPSVQRQHTTDGYRAGLSAGKEDHTVAQAGFDQGYPVGVILGMRTGFLLGILSELGKLGIIEGKVLVEAEEEIEVAKLLKEMGERLGRGIVEELQQDDGLALSEIKDDNDTIKTWSTVDASWIDELPTIKKWSVVVADAGTKLGVDLTYKLYSSDKSEVADSFHEP